MGNLDKNLDKRIDNLKPIPFTKENQPTPEQKKKGWERRREAQKIMDEMLSLTSMSYKEVKELLDDIKVHPENHTLREVKIANYLMEKKFTVDYLDRHISKAPQEVDVTSKGEKLEAVKVEFVINGNNESNESPKGDDISPEDI